MSGVRPSQHPQEEAEVKLVKFPPGNAGGGGLESGPLGHKTGIGFILTPVLPQPGSAYRHQSLGSDSSKGASLKDPARLFNSSLDGNARRAIDIHEGEEVDESAFKVLVRQAVALNSSGKSKPSKKAKS